jgi:DNA-binding Xre family transcriptional regulator
MSYKKKRGNLTPEQSTILLDLKPALAARNIIHPTAYLIKLGINSKTAHNMLKGKAVQLNFIQLTKLCVDLNCTPNDILALRDMNLQAGHELNKLKSIDSTLPNVEQWLKGKTIEEVRELLKE